MKLATVNPSVDFDTNNFISQNVSQTHDPDLKIYLFTCLISLKLFLLHGMNQISG